MVGDKWFGYVDGVGRIMAREEQNHSTQGTSLPKLTGCDIDSRASKISHP